MPGSYISSSGRPTNSAHECQASFFTPASSLYHVSPQTSVMFRSQETDLPIWKSVFVVGKIRRCFCAPPGEVVSRITPLTPVIRFLQSGSE